jgi:hypothetical protein
MAAQPWQDARLAHGALYGASPAWQCPPPMFAPLSRTLCAAALSMLTAAAVAGCGRSLDNPTGLPIRSYPAGKAFTMTLVMTTCSDKCATYSDPACNVKVEGQTLQVEASIAYGDKDDTDEASLTGCSLNCGAPVTVDCAVPELTAGTYTVEANRFTPTIEVR